MNLDALINVSKKYTITLVTFAQMLFDNKFATNALNNQMAYTTRAPFG